MYLNDLIATSSKKKIRRIILNSKDIKRGDLFIPFGGIVDRNEFIADALKKHCCAVITDCFYPSKKVYQVNNLDETIISIFNKYYQYPLNKITLIGVTGTDGKTSVTTILSQLLLCPLLGTNGFIFQDKIYTIPNTTPSLDILYSCFYRSARINSSYFTMEVSSEAYLTDRLGKLPFQIAIFTNITKEHLDKHKNFKNYLECKKKLFANSEIGILNRDSAYYKEFKSVSKKSYSYGFNKNADLRILKYELFIDHTIILITYQKKKYQFRYPLVGKFNVLNIASCLLTLIVLGFDISKMGTKLLNLKAVPGRMEMFLKNDRRIILDYAHTINATLNVLRFYHSFSKNIVTVVGCAGGRYREKRPEIGKIVLKYSSFVIFTMDDPRDEDPNLIIDEMLNGTRRKNYRRIINRKEAIEEAYRLTYKHGILLILGKGRDPYMVMKSGKVLYNDYDVISLL